MRQPKSELVGEHADLAAMVGFVGEHVAEHLWANGPWGCPAVSAKVLDAAIDLSAAAAERFGEHFGAESGALGQCCTSLLRGAVRAVEL